MNACLHSMLPFIDTFQYIFNSSCFTNLNCYFVLLTNCHYHVNTRILFPYWYYDTTAPLIRKANRQQFTSSGFRQTFFSVKLLTCHNGIKYRTQVLALYRYEINWFLLNPLTWTKRQSKIATGKISLSSTYRPTCTCTQF